MKKDVLVITSLVVFVLIFSLFFSYYNDSSKLVFENNESNSVMKNNVISMMYETGYQSGEYEPTSDVSWPSEGYAFNETLSKCENGGTLTWDEASKKALMTSNTSDKCYVYFKKLPTAADKLQERIYLTTSGDTIDMVENIILDKPLDIDRSITLDGAEFTITTNYESGNGIDITTTDSVTLNNIDITTSGKVYAINSVSDNLSITEGTRGISLGNLLATTVTLDTVEVLGFTIAINSTAEFDKNSIFDAQNSIFNVIDSTLSSSIVLVNWLTNIDYNFYGSNLMGKAIFAEQLNNFFISGIIDYSRNEDQLNTINFYDDSWYNIYSIYSSSDSRYYFFGMLNNNSVILNFYESESNIPILLDYLFPSEIFETEKNYMLSNVFLEFLFDTDCNGCYVGNNSYEIAKCSDTECINVGSIVNRERIYEIGYEL